MKLVVIGFTDSKISYPPGFTHESYCCYQTVQTIMTRARVVLVHSKTTCAAGSIYRSVALYGGETAAVLLELRPGLQSITLYNPQKVGGVQSCFRLYMYIGMKLLLVLLPSLGYYMAVEGSDGDRGSQAIMVTQTLRPASDTCQVIIPTIDINFLNMM